MTLWPVVVVIWAFLNLSIFLPQFRGRPYIVAGEKGHWLSLRKDEFFRSLDNAATVVKKLSGEARSKKDTQMRSPEGE
ncbi:hypothetical protein OUZ56_032115 [Daphnia magna]|uniref:Uncharacterized protein n=1 Tax=Daphnia magna TaxID=35525 RepID=A0ABQ9ZW75_9CRUS|nr:hypothetical protein OUZ56_032115 [Daphnia magna]